MSSSHCNVCSKKLRKNQRALPCATCKSQSHLKCSRVTPGQYNTLKASNFDSFACVKCSPDGANPKHVANFLNSLTKKDPYSYDSIEDLNRKLNSESKGDLFVLHFNIVSLVLHKDAIASMISKTKVKPDVICVSESKLKDDKIEWQSKMVDIPNYKLIFDNSKTDAGGVAIYINDAIVKNIKIMPELKLKVDDCESVFIELNFNKETQSDNGRNKQKVLLGCVYRHPRYATSLFIKQLFEKLSIYSEKNTPIIIVGDINIDVHDKSERTFNYINALSSVGCENLIDNPTCFDKGSQSCLDHVITNVDHGKIQYGVLDETATNHLPVYAIFESGTDMGKNENVEDGIQWRYIDERKKELFLTVLEKKVSAINLDEHPENILKALTEATQYAINFCFPLKIQK